MFNATDCLDIFYISVSCNSIRLEYFRCFLFVQGKYFSWDGAQAECQKTGGNLVSISNKEEDEYIASTETSDPRKRGHFLDIYADFNENRFPWIGLHRSAPAPNQGKFEGWTWIDGNNATYRRFDGECQRLSFRYSSRIFRFLPEFNLRHAGIRRSRLDNVGNYSTPLRK